MNYFYLSTPGQDTQLHLVPDDGQGCPDGYQPATQSQVDEMIAALPPVVVHPPSPVVPSSVTNAQFRAALIDAGIMPSQIDSAIQQIPDTNTRLKAQEWWNYANFIDRTSGYVASFAPQFSLTSAQVDSLFISASAQGT